MAHWKPFLQKIVLWLLFFFICLGLGYPTVSRYEPGAVDGLYDARAYAAIVTGSPVLEDQQDLSHRVLVPYLAKPIYALSKNHLGTWNPAYFALLVVNSFFIASTAWLLVRIGSGRVCDYPTALLAAFVFLANFTVSNHHLAGYVDSAIDFVLIAIVWSFLSGRWWTLVCWGVLGALAKETFVPLAVVLTTVWMIAEPRQEMGSRKFSRLVWIGLMSVAGLLTVAFLMTHQSPPYNPLSFAASRQAASGSEHFYLLGLIRCLASHEFLFTFAWLLPLSLPRLRRLPRTWVAGATAAALTALALGAYDDALGNAVRPIFSSVGPLLSLSVAMYLNEMVSQKPISTTSSN